MPQPGTIATHPDRAAIDAAIVAGVPNRRIATQYGLSEGAVRRYKADGLPATLVKAKDAEEATHGDDLLAQLATLQADARRIGARAEGEGDLRTALAAVRELVRMIELLAEMQGELNRAPQINITLSPEWLTLRLVIVQALADHPEAQRAVLGALSASGVDA